MKYSKIFLITAYNLIGNVCAAQMVGDNASKGMDISNHAYGWVTEIKRDEKSPLGNYYLDENWSIGFIVLKDGSRFDNLVMRYNISQELIEIKMDNKLKGVRSDAVHYFELLNPITQNKERYVNENRVPYNGTHTNGFLKEISTGKKYPLYSKLEIKLIKAKYMASLDMGSEEDKYAKKIKYYTIVDKNLIELGTNRKHFSEPFKGSEREISKFIKNERLSVKREEDLIKLFAYANSL